MKAVLSCAQPALPTKWESAPQAWPVDARENPRAVRPREFINPTLTISNTASGMWLVRMQHTVAEQQHLDVQLLLPRSEASLPAVQGQLLDAALDLLTTMRRNLPPGS